MTDDLHAGLGLARLPGVLWRRVRNAACLAAPPGRIDCDPGPPVVAIAAGGYYRRSDATRSRRDPLRYLANRLALLPLHDFLDLACALSDRHLADPGSGRDAALAALLSRWAGGGALLGPAAERQGEFVRQWSLCSVALAAWKAGARDGRGLSPEVRAWLGRLCDAVRDFCDGLDRPGRRNNHFYWGLLGLGAGAAVLGDAALWDRVRRGYARALEDVGPDGLLPREAARGQRAAHYHAFAAQPLFVLSALAEARGDPLAPGDDRLARLIGRVAAWRADPGAARALFGETQKAPAETAWLCLCGGGDCAAWSGRERFIRRLGGDVAMLGLALGRTGGAGGRAPPG